MPAKAIKMALWMGPTASGEGNALENQTKYHNFKKMEIHLGELLQIPAHYHSGCVKNGVDLMPVWWLNLIKVSFFTRHSLLSLLTLSVCVLFYNVGRKKYKDRIRWRSLTDADHVYIISRQFQINLSPSHCHIALNQTVQPHFP